LEEIKWEKLNDKISMLQADDEGATLLVYFQDVEEIV